METKKTAIILFLLAILSIGASSRSYAADVCEQKKQNEVPENYGQLTICLWNVSIRGPVEKLEWFKTESRDVGSAIKELYKKGTLRNGCEDIIVSLHDMNFQKNTPVIFYVNKEPRIITSETDNTIDVIVSVCNGRGTIAVPKNVMTKKWYVIINTLRSDLFQLTYNNPEPNGPFTKKDGWGEGGSWSELGWGFVEQDWQATRLNTK